MRTKSAWAGGESLHQIYFILRDLPCLFKIPLSPVKRTGAMVLSGLCKSASTDHSCLTSPPLDTNPVRLHDDHPVAALLGQVFTVRDLTTLQTACKQGVAVLVPRIECCRSYRPVRSWSSTDRQRRPIPLLPLNPPGEWFISSRHALPACAGNPDALAADTKRGSGTPTTLHSSAQ